MFSQRSSFRRLRTLGAAAALLASFAGCAETDTEPTSDAGPSPGLPDAQPPGASSDAGPIDAGWTPPVMIDAGRVDAAVLLDAAPSDAARPSDAASDATMSLPDATMGRPDAGDAGDVITPLPPDTKPEDWKLNSDSAAECPATPPEIPIIGGPCLGIYFLCGWTHEDGRQYSCTCDWIHWLCI